MYDLILILPVYNEERILEKSVNILRDVFSEDFKDQNYLIVIANNSSSDTTAIIGEHLQNNNKGIIHEYIHTKGRGAAIKSVISKYKSKFYMYIDIDLPVDPKLIKNIVNTISEKDTDILLLKRTGLRNIFRSVFTHCMHLINTLLLNVPYKDVQSGLKVFNSRVATDIIPKCKETGYFMDLEFITLSRKSGMKIFEFPARWINKRYPERDSKVSLIKDSVVALNAILRLFLSDPRYYLLLLVTRITAATYVLLFGYMALRAPVFIKEASIPAIELVLLLFLISMAGVVIWSGLHNRYLQLREAQWIFIVICVFIFLTKPLFSQDIYWNLVHSYGFISGFNPYMSTPVDYPQTYLNSYIQIWNDFPMTHGPLSVLVYSLPLLFSTNFVFVLTILRFSWILILLISANVFLKVMQVNGFSIESRTAIGYIYLLSPLLLINTLLDLHNDIFLTLFILLTILLVCDKRFKLAYLTLIIGGLFKYVTIFFLPVVFIAHLSNDGLTRKFLKNILFTFIIAMFLLVASYLPFMRGTHNVLDVLSGFNIQFEFSKQPSMSSLLPLLMSYIGIPFLITKVLFMFIALAISIGFAYKRKYIHAFTFALLIIIMSTTWTTSWYFLWLLPLILILKSDNESNIFYALVNLTTFGLSPTFIQYLILILFLINYMFKKIKRLFKTQVTNFDNISDKYREIHSRNIKLTGSTSEEMTEFKTSYVSDTLNKYYSGKDISLLDFGCGDGLFCKYLSQVNPNLRITGVDKSQKSIMLAEKQQEGNVSFKVLTDDKLPFHDTTFDVVYAANVFHHIQPGDRFFWAKEIQRVLKPKGLCIVIEHNPYNPVTQFFVNTCEFDRDARLLSAGSLSGIFRQAGFMKYVINYILFFPRHRLFSRLHLYENKLREIPLGAQYIYKGYRPE